VFLVAPCRFYLLGESTGGSVPMVFFIGLFAVAAVSGGLGALIAVLAGSDVGDQFWVWALGGILAVTAWAAYSLLLIGVLWVAGRAPHTVAGVSKSPSHATHTTGEPEQGAWRRRGRDALIPGSLVAFFALLSAIAFIDGAVTTAKAHRYAGEKVIATAEVLRYDDGRAGLGDRHLIVRFPVGDRTLTTTVRADEIDPDARVPKPGERMEVEYLRADPSRVRPAGAAERAESDASGARVFGIICAALGALSGAAYLLGRRRHQKDRDTTRPSDL
jgi:hypothetical protein